MNTKTFNVSMPSDLVKKIDHQAKSQGSNRSDFIRQAVRKQLSALEQWETITKQMRSNYKGPKFSEKQVADVVQRERKNPTT